MGNTDNIPRRIQIDKWTSAELAIHNAIQEVEKMGANSILTDIVTVLQQTKEQLADFIDNEIYFEETDYLPFNQSEFSERQINIIKQLNVEVNNNTWGRHYNIGWDIFPDNGLCVWYKYLDRDIDGDQGDARDIRWHISFYTLINVLKKLSL